VNNGMIVGVCVTAFVSLLVGWLLTRSRAHAEESRLLGWARVSLIGRVEFTGAAREVERDGETWIEVLTSDGRTMRTQPGVVYAIERVPFGKVEEAVVEAVDARNRETNLLRSQRDAAYDGRDERDARIEHLRAALEAARDGVDNLGMPDGTTIAGLKEQLAEALDADTENECPF
jgi:hypothetical protein